MPIWQTLAGALAGALGGAIFGSLIAAAIVAWWTQKWIEGRERRNRRDDLRLDLYQEIVDIVLDNELILATRGSEGDNPSVELQRKWFRVSHRLKLLGSKSVKEAYQTYSILVFQEAAHPIQFRPRDPNEVVRARDRLIDAMAKDVEPT